MAHVRETLQVELPLRHFFESPTVAEQVAVILQDSAQRAKVEAIAQLVLSLAELSDDEVETMLAEKTLSEKVKSQKGKSNNGKAFGKELLAN